ncbi:OmpA family protein [Nocardioides sp. Root140]|uniref:OmpA family protein n=1 Tax=Nocardioides sp. Root140 TaxID=1736460 RepID=UPI00138F981D|nr:OmpA family protein [Nocardioides sp. Root140]
MLLAALAFGIGRGDTESDLKERTQAALEDKGITGAQVDFEGRDGTVDLAKASGTGSTDVEGLVKDVDGVRVADVEGVTAAGDTTGDTSAAPSEEPSSETSAASGDGAAPDCDALQGQVDKVLGPNMVAFGEKASDLAGKEAAQVDKVASLLGECGASVAVTGHTDDRARPTSPLSQGRADAVAAVLEAAGVTVTTAEGVGADGAIGDNSTQEGRDLNRFADITVQ